MNTGYKRRGTLARLLLAVVLTLCMMCSFLLPAHAELDEPIMLDNCDSSTWHGSAGKDYQEKTEGNASVSWTIAKGGSFVVHRTWATPVDATGANYLEFDMYVSSVDGYYSITGGNSIELTSGGNCDVEEIAWNLDSLEVENGWNHISLPVEGGGCDLSRINYMRFYALGHNNTEPYTIKIDNIQLVYRDPADIGGVDIPDDYILGVASPETAIPVIPESDKTPGSEGDENDDTQGDNDDTQTPASGCSATVGFGAGVTVLMTIGGACLALRKKEQGGSHA